MTASSPLPAPNLMPLMRYRDLAEAMTWLEQAFDFEKQIAVSDSDGAVIYGQMSYRGGLIMMGAVRDTDLDKLMRQPDEVGGIGTQSCYLVIDDADTHYARAQEAGAEIVLELKSDGLGRRGYSCRDPEGHIWNFGTYSPGKGLTLTRPDAEPAPSSEEPAPAPRSRKWLMGLVALFAGLGTLGWVFADDIRTNVTQQIALAAGQQAAARAEQAYVELVKVRAEKRKAEDALGKLGKDLEAERARAKTAEGSKQSAADTIAATDAARKAADAERQSAQAARESAEKARQTAEAELASLRGELQRQKAALDEAVESRRVSEEKLAVQAAAAAETAKKLAAAEAAAQASKAEDSKAEASRTDAASKAETAAPSSPAEPSAQQAATSRTEDIETSATRAPAADREPPAAASAVSDEKPDDDDEAKARAKNPEPAERAGRRKSAGKGSRSVPKAKAAPTPRRLPSYNVDVRNVWPYNGWTN